MKSKWCIVIRERDVADNEITIIGVASDRENALKIIKGYYGKGAELSDFKDIRDSMLDFNVKVFVPGKLGGNYYLTGMDYEIDEWYE